MECRCATRPVDGNERHQVHLQTRVPELDAERSWLDREILRLFLVINLPEHAPDAVMQIR